MFLGLASTLAPLSVDSVLAFIIAPLIAGVFSIVAAVLSRKSFRQAKHASRKATEAAETSAQTGDVFVTEVREQLGGIMQAATDARDEAAAARQEAERARDLIGEHLAAHANAHILHFPAEAVAGEHRK